MEELSLDFVQHARVLIELKVYNLPTFNVKQDLPGIRACHENSTLIRLPFCTTSILSAAFNLNQTSARHLDEYVTVKNPTVESRLVGLESRICNLSDFIVDNLKHKSRVCKRDNHKWV